MNWRDALISDLNFEARAAPNGPLKSIFFGGGTPSLMPPWLVVDLLSEAEKLFGFDPDIEITLEANPSSVEAACFAELASAGINRVSLGVQSLNDENLAFLGRAHSVNEALSALAIAQRHFQRVSFDLIYALPGQSEADWARELESAIALGTGHLSLYQLTIEPGTRFETLVRQGVLVPAEDDHAASLYSITSEITASAGIPAYEISNHARPDEESRHNLIYWRYQDYLGVGPGAHGRRGGMATQRHKKPENFLAALDRNSHGIEAETSLAPHEQAAEALIMGLRLAEGVDLSQLAARLNYPQNQMINAGKVTFLTELGLLNSKGAKLTVTPKGMPLLDAILPQIVCAELESEAAA